MGYASDPKPRQAGKAVDTLLFRLLTLPPSELWQVFDRLAGRPEVAAAGWRVSERRLSGRPNAQRDEEWTRLHEEDRLSYGEIAYAHNTNRDTVAKAVQRFRRRRDAEAMSTAASG